jgi:transposase-like protein
MSKLKSLDKLFDGRHFDREIILLCVRWYLRYKLSLRDLVEMMAERGLPLAYSHAKLTHFGLNVFIEN